MEVKLTKPEHVENISIFSSPRYLDAISKNNGWIAGYDNGTLCFVLPYIARRKGIFKYVQFTANIQKFGLGFVNGEDEFLNKTIGVLKDNGFDFAIQPTNNAVFDRYPAGSIFAPFGTYIIDLQTTEERLWDAIHSKHKNVIRKAEKSGVDVVCGAGNKDIAYDIIKDTMARSAMGFYGKNEFDAIINGLGDNVLVFIARCGGVPQGCAVLPFSKHKAYYSFGGSIAAPVLGAMNYMHWQIIRYLKQADVNSYDLVGGRVNPAEGSKQEGLQRFKSRLGAEFVSGFLWKYPLNKFKYTLYSTLTRIKNRGSKDIIDQERCV